MLLHDDDCVPIYSNWIVRKKHPFDVPILGVISQFPVISNFSRHSHLSRSVRYYLQLQELLGLSVTHPVRFHNQSSLNTHRFQQ